MGPPEYAKPPRTYDVDPDTQLTTIVPIQSVTGSVSGTTDVWFQLAYASEATYLSLSISLSLSLLLMQNVCECCFIDNIRYEFTQNGATATSKTLANAVKNMFHDKGFKYHSFVSLFFVLFYFFTFILLFLVCHFSPLVFEVSVHQNWQDGVNHPTACAHVLAVQHVPSPQSSSPEHMYPLTSSPVLTSPSPSPFSLLICIKKCFYQWRYHDNFKHSPKGRVWNQLSPSRRVRHRLLHVHQQPHCISQHPRSRIQKVKELECIHCILPPLSLSSLQLWCKMRWKHQERLILIRFCSMWIHRCLFPSPPWVAFRFRTTPSPCRWAVCLISLQCPLECVL